MKDDKNKWKNIYEFTLEVFEPIDYEQMSYHVSHNSKSIFVKNRICVIPKPEGRILLNNYDLTIVTHGNETRITLRNDEEYINVLKKYFGIELPKNTRFKEIAAVNNTKKVANNTSTWCTYFNRTAIVIGVAGSVYLANQYVKNNRFFY